MKLSLRALNFNNIPIQKTLTVEKQVKAVKSLEEIYFPTRFLYSMTPYKQFFLTSYAFKGQQHNNSQKLATIQRVILPQKSTLN